MQSKRMMWPEQMEKLQAQNNLCSSSLDDVQFFSYKTCQASDDGDERCFSFQFLPVLEASIKVVPYRHNQTLRLIDRTINKSFNAFLDRIIPFDNVDFESVKSMEKQKQRENNDRFKRILTLDSE